MISDLLAIFIFIILVFCTCIIYSNIMLKNYKSDKKLEFNLEDEKIQLVGIGVEEEKEFSVEEAIKKIEVPTDLRLKL